MRINEAIRTIMREKGVTLQAMADAIGKKQGKDVSSFLAVTKNMTMGNARKMLDVLGYEIIIRPKDEPLGTYDVVVTE